ncbi:DUF4157 domain-containing protein [Paucibacter sp. R3-3]|uniref:DUF4157 domain-containing protein n=1 Tax=Roseateles agri TaxID=3098619 RepID=A0ABU5DG77_9BURK|nr:DUF4157 domain-containing protein [Paucibacter sp. R3-3]MDY0745288.1 DUF4157 domain-containing protein [Paucibacter sp. R3-3]
MSGLTARHRSTEAGEGQAHLDDVPLALRGGGQSLPAMQRRTLETGLGRDLSGIRLHQGPAAQASSATLRARAYTLGNDVVLGRGAPPLHTRAGLHLLAHELAHTAQPGAANTVRRAPFDYEIDDLPVGAAADTSTIYFDRDSVTLSPGEKAKIAGLVTPPGQDLTLHAYSSEEPSMIGRIFQANMRLASVDAALAAAGHTGKRTLVPHPDDGLGNLDYRSMRTVQVFPTPVGMPAAPPQANACQAAGAEIATGAEKTKCENAFKVAFPIAKAIVDKAEKDVVTTPTAAANALVAQFFAGVARPDVDATVSALAAQVRNLQAAHECHTVCDGGCKRPAFNDGHGLAPPPAGALMKICPDWVSAPLDFQVDILIHESSHGTPAGDIVDVAYHNTRLVPFLLPADAKRNTDSYVILMRLVHKAGSIGVGPVAADTLKGMTAVGAGSDTEQTQRAVAWLESWLNYGDFDTSVLYATLQASLLAGHWDNSGTNEFNIETQHRLALAFPGDFTDPGPDRAPRTTPPAPMATSLDKERVAALHDRFAELYRAVNQRPITVTRGPAGAVEKRDNTVSHPYLLPTVTVSPAFFALGKVDQVKRLFGLMVHGRYDISAPFEAKYVDALDRIHAHRKMGP